MLTNYLILFTNSPGLACLMATLHFSSSGFSTFLDAFSQTSNISGFLVELVQTLILNFFNFYKNTKITLTSSILAFRCYMGLDLLYNFFNLYKNTLITLTDISGFTLKAGFYLGILLLILGLRMFSGKGIIEGLKAALTFFACLATGAGLGNTANDQADRNERKATEEEARKQTEAKEEATKNKDKDETNKQRLKFGDLKNNYTSSSSYILAWILANVNVEITESSSQLLQFSYYVFLASILTLFCVLNLIGYILSNYILDKVNYDKNFPTLAKFINKYKKLSLFYLSIDILIILYLLSLLAFYSLVIVAQLHSSL